MDPVHDLERLFDLSVVEVLLPRRPIADPLVHGLRSFATARLVDRITLDGVTRAHLGLPRSQLRERIFARRRVVERR
jgi:hypothetical protein